VEISTRFAQVYIRHGFNWFRVFGWGLHWKDLRCNPLLFLERNGYLRRLQVGPWSIRVLKPQRWERLP
jgi:hypothetical protein